MDNKDFIKQWAQDDWNVGMTFDPDDYDTFCKICKEQGIECNYDLFEYYFECLDEIRTRQFEDFKVEVNHDENGTKINAEGNDADEIVDLAKFIFGDDFDSEFDGPVDEEEIPAVEVPVDMIKIEEPHQVGEIKDEDIFEQEFDIEPIVAAAPEAEQAIASIEKVAVDAPCEGECCDGHCEEKHICPECGKELCECDKLEKDELLQEAALTSDFIKSMIDETKADLDKAESEEEKSTLQSKLDKLNSDYESLAKAEKALVATKAPVNESNELVDCIWCLSPTDISKCVHDREYGWICKDCLPDVKEKVGKLHLDESQYTCRIADGIVFGIETDSEKAAEKEVKDKITGLSDSKVEFDGVVIEAREITDEEKDKCFKEIAADMVSDDPNPTTSEELSEYCFKNFGYRTNEEDFKRYQEILDGYADEDLSEKEPTATDLEKIEKELPPSWEDGWDDLSDEEFVEAFGKTLINEGKLGDFLKLTFEPIDKFFSKYKVIKKYSDRNQEIQEFEKFADAKNMAINFSKQANSKECRIIGIKLNSEAIFKPYKDEIEKLEKEVNISSGDKTLQIYQQGKLVKDELKKVKEEIVGLLNQAKLNSKDVSSKENKESSKNEPQESEQVETEPVSNEQPNESEKEQQVEEPKQEEQSAEAQSSSKGDRLNRQISNNKKINQALKDAGLDIPEDKLYTVYTDKAGKQRKKATDTLNALRNTLFGESLDEE